MSIVGDILHSRVARSGVWAFAALGAEVTLVAPGSLVPPSLDGWPVASVSHDIESVLPKTDVCYMLRLQAERGAGSFLPSAREYTASFGLTARRAALLPDDAVVMHPGPMIRGLEISDEVADLPRSVIRRQVTNGVAVRMAVLYLLLGTGDLLSQHGGGSEVPERRERPVVVRGGTVIDSTGERRADVVIEGGVIVAVTTGGEGAALTAREARVCSTQAGASSCRDSSTSTPTPASPGAEETETVESAARAAALGGFTAFVAMPNTDPAIDCAPVAREVLELGTGAMCRVCVAGAITVGTRWGATRADGGARRPRREDLHRRRDGGPRRRGDAAGNGLRGGSRCHPCAALRGHRSGGRRSHARRGVVEQARCARGSGVRPSR